MTNPNDLKIVSIRTAKVTEVKFGNPKKAGDKKPLVDLLLDNGPRKKNVPFYGFTIDVGDTNNPGTDRPHGIYQPPVIGQKVCYEVSFEQHSL